MLSNRRNTLTSGLFFFFSVSANATYIGRHSASVPIHAENVSITVRAADQQTEPHTHTPSSPCLVGYLTLFHLDQVELLNTKLVYEGLLILCVYVYQFI